MAFIPVPNVAEVEVICSYLGQRIENTLYFLHDGAITPTDLGNLAAAVGAWFDETLLPDLSDQLLHLITIATDITSSSTPSLTHPAPPSTVGGNGSPPAPGNVTWTISFHTAERGRSARGRNYIMGLGSNSLSGNQVVSAFADGVREAYAALPTVAGIDGIWTHVVVSRFHAGAPRTEGVTFPVTAYVITNYDADSQRRRLAGRGT